MLVILLVPLDGILDFQKVGWSVRVFFAIADAVVIVFGIMIVFLAKLLFAFILVLVYVFVILLVLLVAILNFLLLVGSSDGFWSLDGSCWDAYAVCYLISLLARRRLHEWLPRLPHRLPPPRWVPDDLSL